jgi:hypothetical protein
MAKYLVAFSYVTEEGTWGFSNTPLDRPIRSMEDTRSIEREIAAKVKVAVVQITGWQKFEPENEKVYSCQNK